MPLAKPNKDEDSKSFINRCMSDEKMKAEYPDTKQRVAVCYSQLRKSRPNTDKEGKK